MSDPLIKSVNHSPRVQDALNKPDSRNKTRARPPGKKIQQKKDSKRIIDTYA